MEWFIDRQERNNLIRSINLSAKSSFIGGIVPTLLKASVSRGNREYKHRFSNWLYSGFRIQSFAGRSLTKNELTRDITKMQCCGKDWIDETHRLCDVIGTHSARRTFVVHALEMGWSPQLVMTFTGHEDYDTMKPYIAMTDKTRKKMMDTNF